MTSVSKLNLKLLTYTNKLWTSTRLDQQYTVVASRRLNWRLCPSPPFQFLPSPSLLSHIFWSPGKASGGKDLGFSCYSSFECCFTPESWRIEGHAKARPGVMDATSLVHRDTALHSHNTRMCGYVKPLCMCVCKCGGGYTITYVRYHHSWFVLYTMRYLLHVHNNMCINCSSPMFISQK